MTLLIWIAYILGDAIVNWYLIEKKNITPFYLPMNLIRGGAAIIYGGAVLDVQPDDWRLILTWVMHTGFTFPFLFNSLLNLFRSKPIGYIGKESGWIDSFAVKYGLEDEYYYLTLILFVIAINVHS